MNSNNVDIPNIQSLIFLKHENIVTTSHILVSNCGPCWHSTIGYNNYA